MRSALFKAGAILSAIVLASGFVYVRAGGSLFPARIGSAEPQEDVAPADTRFTVMSGTKSAAVDSSTYGPAAGPGAPSADEDDEDLPRTVTPIVSPTPPTADRYADGSGDLSPFADEYDDEQQVTGPYDPYAAAPGQQTSPQPSGNLAKPPERQPNDALWTRYAESEKPPQPRRTLMGSSKSLSPAIDHADFAPEKPPQPRQVLMGSSKVKTVIESSDLAPAKPQATSQLQQSATAAKPRQAPRKPQARPNEAQR